MNRMKRFSDVRSEKKVAKEVKKAQKSRVQNREGDKMFLAKTQEKYRPRKTPNAKKIAKNIAIKLTKKDC